MSQHPRAGQPALPSELVDVPALLRAYDEIRPDPSDPAQRVAFGTSGHRGSAFRAAFNEAHILATTEAICRYRAAQGYTGPAVHRPRHARAERARLADRARGAGRRTASTCASTARTASRRRRRVSHAILGANRGRTGGLADGIVVTPSHNPPDDGGFKYNPPNGGPADTDVTRWIQDEANRILEATGRRRARRHPPRALRAGARAGGRVRLPRRVRRRPRERHRHGGHRGRPGCASGVDPLGGAAVAYWGLIGERYGLDLTVTNEAVDPARSGS